MAKPLNTILYLNPRVNADEKAAFEKSIFEQKQNGVKINMSIIARKLIEKFNDNPGETLEFLNIK